MICKYTHFWADSGYTRKYRFIFGLPALILIVILPVTWEVPSPHYTTTAAEAAASPHFPLKWLFVHITRGAGGTLTGCLIIILIESHQLTQMARGNPESYKFHQSKRQTFKIWLEGSTYIFDPKTCFSSLPSQI